MTAHHYTKTDVETAAAAINAGTCLEDANMEKNVFTYAVDAVNQVCFWYLRVYMEWSSIHDMDRYM